MKDREIQKFREVLGIEEEIKVPEPDVEDVVSVKTTAFFKADKHEKANSATTPKSKQKITRKTIEQSERPRSPFEVDNIS